MTLKDDFLKGAKRIAEYTGFDEREIYAMAKSGTLPLFKVGRHLCGRISAINDRLGGPLPRAD